MALAVFTHPKNMYVILDAPSKEEAISYVEQHRFEDILSIMEVDDEWQATEEFMFNKLLYPRINWRRRFENVMNQRWWDEYI